MSRASGTTQRTLELYHLTLGRFISYSLTPEDINAYLQSLACGNAKHNYYRVIKTLCRWLYHTGQVPNNPVEFVSPPKRQKKLLPAITKEQFSVLLSHCHCERDKAILNFLWHSEWLCLSYLLCSAFLPSPAPNHSPGN